MPAMLLRRRVDACKRWGAQGSLLLEHRSLRAATREREQILLLRSLRASRTRDVVCELRGGNSATSLLLGLTRLAQAFHEHAPVELVSSVLVVGAAHETDSARVMNVRLREPVDVVELEPTRLAASPSVLGDEGASAFVPQVDL